MCPIKESDQRVHCVRYKGILSENQTPMGGDPQGTKLGSFCFFVQSNDSMIQADSDKRTKS